MMNAFVGDAAEELTHFAIPKLNVGLIDVITGREQAGEMGESIINGGLNNHISWTGIANASKTLDLLHFLLVALIRYWENTDGHVADTENTLEYLRIVDFTKEICRWLGVDFDSVIKPILVKKLPLIPKSKLGGTEWEKLIKDMRDTRVKIKAKDKLKTPLIDHMGDNILMNKPHLAAMDSWSEFAQDSMEAAQDKAAAGHKDRNMEFITDNKGKFQLMKELQNILPQADVYLSSSVHLADNIQLDPNADKKAKLEVLGRDNKLRGVPTNFYAYPWTIFFIYSSKSLLDDNRLPLYPEEAVDKTMKRDGELTLLDVYTARSKVGQTKINFPMIISQSKGVLPALSEFHYLKDYCNRFGITGNGTETNLQNYHLDLCPDIPLSRTTIRRQIDKYPELRLALEHTTYLYQIDRYWKNFDQSLLCTPKELYEDLKKLGYNWDELLKTRNYWTFDQYTNPVRYLSIIDLLKMRAGLYKPYWMKD